MFYKGAVAQIAYGLLHFRLAVHDNRSFPVDGLTQRFAGQGGQTHPLRPGLDRQGIATIKKHRPLLRNGRLAINKILEANTTVKPLATVAATLPEAGRAGSDVGQTFLSSLDQIALDIQEAMKTENSLTSKDIRYLEALVLRLNGKTYKEVYVKAYPNTTSNDNNILNTQGKKYCKRTHKIANDKLGIVFNLNLLDM